MLNRMFALLCAFVLIGTLARADQSNTWSPTTGTVSGLQLTNNFNGGFKALQTCNSGASAPANDISAAAVKGQCWLDTSVTPNVLRQYDGTSWIIKGYIDTTNHRWLPPIGGGTATLASATTTDLGGSANSYLTISGTTTITGFGSTAVTGTMKVLTFSGVMQLTYSNPGLILPTGGNITTAVGDTALVVATGSGNATVIAYNKADGTALSSSNNVAAVNLANSALGFNAPVNFRLNATVGSSALTIALKGVNNADPSSANPVPVVFRDATLANGDPVVVSIQAATSIVIPSTATLGATNGVPFRGWIVAYNNGGTAVLGVINCSDASHIYPMAENGVASPTNGAGNSAGVQYSGAGVTANSAFRIIGFFEYGAGLATAGTYNIAPTTVQIFGPGIKKPGDVVQTVYATSTAPTTGSGTTLVVTTPSASVTPTASPNLIEAVAYGDASQSITAGFALAQLYRAAGGSPACTTAFGSKGQNGVGAGNLVVAVAVHGLDAPGSASQQTYVVCLSNSTAGANPLWCGNGTVTQTCTIMLKEIMGRAPQFYDNDNDPRLLNAVG